MQKESHLVLIHNSGKYFCKKMEDKLTDELSIATLFKDQYEVQQTLTFLPNHYEFKVKEVELEIM